MTDRKKILTYSEMIRLPTFEQRLDYLRLRGTVGQDTFGFDRIFNQKFYQNSIDWKRTRDKIITRDLGCDLAVTGRDIYDRIIIHHMNPITLDDIRDATEFLFNPEYLVCTSQFTHNAIHYGRSTLPRIECVERRPNDTCPWKRKL